MTHMLKKMTFVAALAAVFAMLTAEADAGAWARKTYYIAVNAGGSKARGTTGSKSKPLNSDGHYMVSFPVKVSTCAYAATVGRAKAQTQPNGSGSGAVSQVTPVAGKPGSLFVVTSKQGAATDLDFYLIVTC